MLEHSVLVLGAYTEETFFF